MKSLSYKNFTATVEYYDDLNCFVGEVDNVKDFIVFDGSEATIEQAFKDAIDEYLEFQPEEKVSFPINYSDEKQISKTIH